MDTGSPHGGKISTKKTSTKPFEKNAYSLELEKRFQGPSITKKGQMGLGIHFKESLLKSDGTKPRVKCKELSV